MRRLRLPLPAPRTLVIVLVVGCLLGCPAALWAALQRGHEVLVLPGATDVVVTAQGPLERRLTYHAPTGPMHWRDQTWQLLVAQGWQATDYTFGTTRTFAVTWYRRERALGPLRIVESAVVGGDPRDPTLVIIEFHREFHLSSW